MPQVLPWPPAPDGQQSVLETCAQALLRGDLVALPTESAYVAAASALKPEAVARLTAWHPRLDSPPPAVALRNPVEARDWCPELGPLGQRLAQRCWPGPVILVLTHGTREGVASRLPEGVRRTICPGGTVSLTVPYHPAVRRLVEAVPMPVVLGEICPDGVPATAPEAVQAAAGDGIAALVADGPTRFRQPATVVELRGEQWQVRREGVVSAAEVSRLTARLIVFVCTGNTCRSPLAEALCKKMLAERLGCPVEDLPQRGFVVISAGLAAARGEPAAEEAVAVARALGADLSGHASRPATPELLAQADWVIGMTGSHVAALAGYAGFTRGARLLGGAAGDLADPIGGDRSVYEACARAITGHLEQLVAELLA